MKNTIRALVAVAGVVLAWEACFRPLLSIPASGQPVAKAKDNEELAKLYAEDQADRRPKGGKPIDWEAVAPRDWKRLEQVMELYKDGKLQTGADYYHAAMVLQHAPKPEDYLLAHELCVVAIGKGEERGEVARGGERGPFPDEHRPAAAVRHAVPVLRRRAVPAE
jgi:hypothetical protein